MWSKLVHVCSAALHWLTGWIVHPDNGGCCQSHKIFEEIETEEKDTKK